MPTPSPSPGSTPLLAADDRLMTLSAAAEYLSVSRSFVQKCIYTTRTLPAVKIGKNIVRVRLSDVLALLAPVAE